MEVQCVRFTDLSGYRPDLYIGHQVYGHDIIALDVEDFTARKVGAVPPPHAGGYNQPTLSGDAQWLWRGHARPDGKFIVTDDLSSDRHGRYVVFNSTRTHQAVGLIGLSELPAQGWP